MNTLQCIVDRRSLVWIIDVQFVGIFDFVSVSAACCRNEVLGLREL
jgi:hypothetical protein